MDISSVDLNLLHAFDALLGEKSVTRAARRLGLSQPAMSHALARLREGVGDQLFERTRHGIRPTPRAMAMGEPVRSALATLQAALLEPAEAAAAPRTVHVAANLYAELVVMPHVARALPAAPKPIAVRLTEPATMGSSADAALTLDWAAATPRSGRLRALVLRDEWVCVVGRNRLKGIARFSIDGFLDAGQVAVGDDRVGDPIDLAVAKLKRRRRIVVQASNFAAVAAIAASTDLVGAIPRRLASLLAPRLELRLLKPPLELRPLSLEVSWSRRGGADPLTTWLRSRLVAAGREIGGGHQA